MSMLYNVLSSGLLVSFKENSVAQDFGLNPQMKSDRLGLKKIQSFYYPYKVLEDMGVLDKKFKGHQCCFLSSTSM